jgi:ABC-type transport system involved in multi-copper enzyme maturation permease subunit
VSPEAIVRAVRSELLKFTTTRLWWGLAIGVFVSAAAFALLFGLLYTSDSFMNQSGDGPFGGTPVADDVQVANSVYTAGLSVGYLLMLVIGVVQIGAEYRHRTVTSTFLAEPRRPRVMLGKVLALILVAAAYGVLSMLGSVLVGALTLEARGADAFPSAEVVRTLALSLLVLGLWALIGLGVGILIPHQVAALLIAVGVAWIVEPLVGVAIKAWDFGQDHVAPYLPSEATSAVVNVAQASGDDVRLSWWAGALVLAAWAAAFAGAGIVRVVRQDIT